MRRILLFMVIAVIPLLAQNPQPKKAGPQKPQNKTLGEIVSKAGLKALKAIQAEAGEPEVRNGAIYVPKQTQALIDDADIEAVNDPEKQVVLLLNKFFITRIMHNQHRELIKSQIVNASFRTSPQLGIEQRELLASQEMMRREDVQQMLRFDEACAAGLEKILRSRLLTEPPKCTEESKRESDTR